MNRRAGTAAALLLAASGCNSDRPTRVAISPGSTSVTNSPVAAQQPSATSPLSRAPTVVSTAFVETHPTASVQRVRPHSMPDGSVRYRITFDESGRHSQLDYLADGSLATP